MSAILSPCEKYRYILTRDVPSVLSLGRPCLFIMLNPSTADANKDDATIRKCMRFAEHWGCDRLTVVNLFALRATDPAGLYGHRDAVGPQNDRYLEVQVSRHLTAGIIVAAWGAHPKAQERTSVRDILAGAGVKCLGTTSEGHPRHPLYVPYSQPLVDWKP